MLEVVSGMTLCGVIEWNDCYEDIYCDEVGQLAFDSSQDGGCWGLAEVNIGEPMPMVNTLGLRNNMESGVYGDCIGVVYANNGDIVVLLDEVTAVLRKLWAPLENVGEPFYYNTDIDYEPEGDVVCDD